MITARETRELGEHARGAGPALRALGVAERAQAIERACALLLDRGALQGRELRDALVRSTGLSAASIEHGLQTTLGGFRQDALLALHASRPARARPAPALATVVLAGNVFSAAARPLLLPLTCGCPVLLKAASSDDVLPQALQRALAEVDVRIGEACAVVTFAREDVEHTTALLDRAELLTVYGDDDTIAALRAMAPAGTAVISRGHGVGLAFVAASVLDGDARAANAAERLARDVAAYDQRGCLSPQAVFVQRGGGCDGRRFAVLLADALAALAASWSRGALPAEAAAAQLQWRGVAAATSELHVRDGCAVAYAAELPLRASPGYRNVTVHDIGDVGELRARIALPSVQLKALGVAGVAELAALRGAAPYVCELGAMQEPPLAAPLDGLHPLAGL